MAAAYEYVASHVPPNAGNMAYGIPLIVCRL
jgi:hypothetical protein